jgi:hypothetical protein
VAGAALLVWLVFAVAAEGDESIGGLWFLAAVAMTILYNVAAWRQRLRLTGGVLYQQHTIKTGSPLSAQEIVGVTLHRERGYREPWRHLLLRLWLADGDNRAYSRRWWARWPSHRLARGSVHGDGP